MISSDVQVKLTELCLNTATVYQSMESQFKMDSMPFYCHASKV